jgi:hypothetical protein
MHKLLLHQKPKPDPIAVLKEQTVSYSSMRASWLHPFILVAFSIVVLLDIGINVHLPDNTA